MVDNDWDDVVPSADGMGCGDIKSPPRKPFGADVCPHQPFAGRLFTPRQGQLAHLGKENGGRGAGRIEKRRVGDTPAETTTEHRTKRTRMVGRKKERKKEKRVKDILTDSFLKERTSVFTELSVKRFMYNAEVAYKHKVCVKGVEG
jgi:hypothetical protein